MERDREGAPRKNWNQTRPIPPSRIIPISKKRESLLRFSGLNRVAIVSGHLVRKHLNCDIKLSKNFRARRNLDCIYVIYPSRSFCFVKEVF